MLKPSEIDDAVVIQRVMAALRARAPTTNRKGWVGRTADELDVHEDTLANWLHGETGPSCGRLIALFALLGREFTDEIIELAGLCCARIDHMEAVADGIDYERLKTFYDRVKDLVDESETTVIDLKEATK